MQKVTLDDAPTQHPENGDSEVEVEAGESQNGEKKAKKPKRRTGKGKKRGTGFEEFFCDPPMTPAEYNEEQEIIYPSHRPFVDRIEECIQRFRARRRIGVDRDVVFSRYLFLGGIDSTTRQFQGTRNIGDDILDDATKGAVREMTADDVIQRGGDGNRNVRFYNPNYPEHWDVDFTGVTAGFLSEHLFKMAGSGLAEYRMGVEVVLNFLKYVDLHGVCPEYADDVKRAQRVCLQAMDETPVIKELLELVPGVFNTCLRILHCKPDEVDALDMGGLYESEIKDPTFARVSFSTSLGLLYGINRYPLRSRWTLVDTKEQSFEITAITFPTEETLAKYKAINKHLAAKFPNDIEPCGAITVRRVIVHDGWDNSMTETIPAEEAGVETQFIFEEKLLRLMRVGMKLTVGVCTLDSGVKFIKYVKAIRPSFHVFLPQELMFNYREPVPNDRPARSVHDREEDGGGGAGGDGDD
ncbi:Argonaute complex, subunit Arb1 [Staphylotrichum tortipilum]|uniref:Argonaute complex, subunit Arb1 n=1 Tax=Staphylotrichum tortipilum TaxID=2831512 RepID=A0AAN6MGP3_9PEZI|nr:Argonaute complex, subunit Arb1 [Staphylotrichum longicolle]